MIRIALVAFLLAVAQSSSQKETRVGRVCGTLVYAHEVPTKNASAEPRYQQKPMGRAPVFLYYREESAACCQGLLPVAKLETGHWGHFEFKNVQPGPYWIVVRSKGGDSSTPVRYAPSKEFETSCSEYTFILDDAGKLEIGLTITVD